MKVLSRSITAKTLTGGGMEPFIECPLDGNAKVPALPHCLSTTEEQAAQSIENSSHSKWSVLRKWRKSSSPLNSVSVCPDTDSKIQLFGQPLCCSDDGMLPKPITDILVLLWRKGPSTEGVFRKTGNNKNLKAIREQLNSGADVELETQPVVILVGLLKSFLKELPGSLLVSDLYDTWMKALEMEEDQQRGLELKRVVDKLPGPNLLLLQNILCVLHRITESSVTNMMDAKNLALCIAPTLLQKDITTLDVQTAGKVTELTQFLIEHCCEIFGDEILSFLGVTDEDNSVSSQQHDSAYDSTDPDAEEDSMGSAQEEGEKGGSFPSLLSVPSCPSDDIFHTKPFNRRRSEPIIFLSAGTKNLIGQARSHDDFSVEGQDFGEQPLKKQISNDSFLLPRRGGAEARPVATLSLPKLGGQAMIWRQCDLSCSSSVSLESATSNASEGSVFTSSPLGSPACLRRAQSTRGAPLTAKPRAEAPRADPAEAVKRRTQSMKVDSNALMRTKSLGAFGPARGSLKKADAQKEKTFLCGTVQEDFQSETEATLRQPRPQPRPQSAMEVFQKVDSRLPSQPPPYELAVHNAAQPALPHYGSMTVSDAAATLSRKTRPASMNANFQYSCPVSQHTDRPSQATDIDSIISGQQPSVQLRHRTMSESVPITRVKALSRHESVSRRCSQPMFDYSYAKESYV
ncbi:hypothetical protein UPYG_G00275820 [Umbra pygmaea]|uniref:Rho-GAP domain-containing protein n=1 Tax=Umbra pygmaea TaxID=75934 RepID=A0ABD0W3X9_UMBPY